MHPIPLLGLLTWCAALSAADLRHRRLPNLLTLPGAAVVFGYAWLGGRWAVALVGALLLAVPYLVIHLTMPSALGAGDVKLALGLGGACALAGAQAWVWAAITAPLLTALAGAGTLLAARARPGGRCALAGAPAWTWAAADPVAHPRRTGGPPAGGPRRAAPGDSLIGSHAELAEHGLPRPMSPVVAVPPATLAHGAAMCAASVAAIMLTR
ncbi:prepilin peptidase [Nocardia otitidiscaviarum]|uniref:prepilin peptidase n=1 Tax=Nocardia otitidiscaviarum TaxID=1823 RepID=UPI0007C6C51E|nr:A24 family peptidase [Nocardia otitidiscaviarum]MBF6135345.1 prepilin peptidase [Nocardia otitidiscaviarum]MBF6487166.1 prepilin peptidase [Nocardia otitidiscaviarum]